MNGITTVYNRSATNSQVDYFDEMYYSSINIESEHSAAFWAREKEHQKAKRAARKARGQAGQ